jgi:hypothetical protein
MANDCNDVHSDIGTAFICTDIGATMFWNALVVHASMALLWCGRFCLSPLDMRKILTATLGVEVVEDGVQVSQ